MTMTARSRAGRLATAALLGVIVVAPAAHGQKTDATSDLAKCQKTAAKEGAKLAKEMEKRLGGCLQRVADEVVKLGLEGDAAAPAEKCAKDLRKLHDSRDLGKSSEEKLRAKVAKKCDPADAAFDLEDLLGPGAAVDEPLAVAGLDAWCAEYGGDGAIDDLDEWLDCLVAATRCRSGQVLTARYPRALEWLDQVGTAIAGLPAGGDPAAIPDALDGLDAFVAMMDPNGDQEPDTRCVAPGLCPPGRFSVDGQTPCADCPVGTFAADTGAAACTDCPPGRFADSPGVTACAGCGAGTFQAVPGQEACAQCPPGRFAPTSAASACDECAAGHFAAAPGSTVCSECPLGAFAASTGAEVCDPCPAGSFAGTTATIMCDPCPPGRFQATPGSTSCQVCEPGFFQNESGHAACEPCPSGTFASENESTACDPCVPGAFQASPGASACLECAQGQFNDDFGQASCTDCPPGRVGTTTGATTCQSCAAGTFQATPGQTACADCAPETYGPATGLTQCFPCTGAIAGASTCSCTAPM